MLHHGIWDETKVFTHQDTFFGFVWGFGFRCEFAYSPCACASFLQLLCFAPTLQNQTVALSEYSILSIGLNLSMNDCVSICVLVVCILPLAHNLLLCFDNVQYTYKQ